MSPRQGPKRGGKQQRQGKKSDKRGGKASSGGSAGGRQTEGRSSKPGRPGPKGRGGPGSGKPRSTKEFYTYHTDRDQQQERAASPKGARGPRRDEPRSGRGGFSRPNRPATRPEDRFEIPTPESDHPRSTGRIPETRRPKAMHVPDGEETAPFRERGRERRQELKKIRGTVDKNRKGFAFLSLDSREFEDLFIPPHEAEALFHGDRVEVTINSRDEVTDIAIVEHRFRELVGRYSPNIDPDRPASAKSKVKSGFVIYERRNRREEVFVPNAPAGVEPGDWVLARLQFQGAGTVTAEIVRAYGEHLPPTADIEMVSGEYNLIEHHTEAAEREARALKLDLPEHGPIPDRVDLRDVPLITIDGETARDFDDAVYVERKGAGFSLWVAIADVSHYVKPDSAIDKEAYARATSVYFPERAFHMLPRALSENLCSLRPHEPRMAMAARIDFDSNGRRLKTEVFEAVIESKRRATYTEIEAEKEQNEGDPNWEFAQHFELYRHLRRQRSERGSIDFEFPEAETRVDENGEPTSISVRDRLDAHRLIEEFMIAANEAVTDWMMERRWPFVYRVHEEPDPKALDRFVNLAATMGADLQMAGDFTHPKQVADAIRNLSGHPAEKVLNFALLRSLKQAIYTPAHGIHYGLASEGYTHFTSPIRRYPDLIVHRLIREAIRVENGKRKKPSGDELDKLEKYLEEATAHCSYRERVAAEAERESIKLKQIRMMMKHLGEEFDGTVIGLHEKGMFIEILEPYAEGMIARESLDDDFYVFNEERMIFYGRRKKRTFRIGDKVRIRVVRADIDERRVEFELLEHKPVESNMPGAEGLSEESPRRDRRDSRERNDDRRPDRSSGRDSGRRGKGRGGEKSGGGDRGGSQGRGRGNRSGGRKGRR